MGEAVSRKQIRLTGENIAEIARTYHSWRGQSGAGVYEDVPGFCRVGTFAEIEAQGFAVSPGRYVGSAEIDDDVASFDERMAQLIETLAVELDRAEHMTAEVKTALGAVGYDL